MPTILLMKPSDCFAKLARYDRQKCLHEHMQSSMWVADWLVRGRSLLQVHTLILTLTAWQPMHFADMHICITCACRQAGMQPGVGNNANMRASGSRLHRACCAREPRYPAAAPGLHAECDGSIVDAQLTFISMPCYVQEVTNQTVFGFNLGLDGAQMYNKKQHTAWLFVLQCANLPEEYRSQSKFIMPLAVIPGPKQAPQPFFNGLMRCIALEFKAGLHGARMSMAGTTTPVMVWWLLLSIVGDTPAIRHVTLHQGCTGTRGCTHCKGVAVLDGTTNRWPPVLQHGVEIQGDPSEGPAMPLVELPVGHPDTTLGHAKHVKYGMHVEEQLASAPNMTARARINKEVGVHGLCEFARGPRTGVGRYFDYDNMVLVPLAHAALYGVVKDWLLRVLQLMAPHPRALQQMAERATHITSTCDQGRHYFDFTTKLKYYTMEEVLNFLEFYSLYIFDGIFSSIGMPYLNKMWYLLRHALCFFFRKEPVVGVASDVDTAMASLQEYAHMVHVVHADDWGIKFCKYNLHILLCRLGKQVKERGPAYVTLEFYIERAVQSMLKEPTRGRVTRNAETTAVGSILQQKAVRNARGRFPELASGMLLTAKQLLRTPDAEDEHPLHQMDRGDSAGNQLLGVGLKEHRMTPEHLGVCKEACKSVIEYVQDVRDEGWAIGDEEGATFSIFSRADVAGREVVHSERYGRNITRMSYHVLCAYEEPWCAPGERQHYIATMQMFAMAEHAGRPVLRFGVAKLQPAEVVQCGVYQHGNAQQGFGVAYRTQHGNTRVQGYMRIYGVRLEDIRHKVVQAHKPGERYAYYYEYGNMSNTGRHHEIRTRDNIADEPVDRAPVEGVDEHIERLEEE